MTRFRKPVIERLDQRQLFASDCSWHNHLLPSDVDNDRVVSAIDALIVINSLNHGDETNLGATTCDPVGRNLVDVNNDGWLSPIDALRVINELNLQSDQARFGTANKARFTAKLSPIEEAEGANSLLTTNEVGTLLNRASQASRSSDAIIAVVDRGGRILGVRIEEGVSSKLKTDPIKLAFAIDGAVAKARTAAFFSNKDAPLTSRTIRFISQSTVTQREVESSPQNTDPRYVGPGFVAPIGVGGHFPPQVPFTPQVDLFAIEHQSRDSQLLNGLDGVRGSDDDVQLKNRFNVDPRAVASGAEAFFKQWPESYGFVTNTPTPDNAAYWAQSRGIATLPGGIPLYKKVTAEKNNLVGGIGVFFPGEDGFATYEQGFKHQSANGGVVQTEAQRTNASRVLESEFIAFIAAAGSGVKGPSAFVRDLGEFNSKLEGLPNFFLPVARIDLVGITLEIYGPNATTANPIPGIDTLIAVGRSLGVGASNGVNAKVTADEKTLLAGQAVPERWLVVPHDSSDGKLKAAQVEQMINQAVAQAELTRAAIRLNANFRPGARTRMVISVADTNGELLGVYRMPDATVFSIDVSIAKARNTAYYADEKALQPQDRVDFNADGIFGEVTTSLNGGDTLPLGTALTNRTFRFLAEPRYPTGINLPSTAAAGLVNNASKRLVDQRRDIALLVGPHSILQLPGLNPLTGENLDNNNPLPVSVYASIASKSTVAFDAFNPSRNFRDPGDPTVKIAGTAMSYRLANQNGVVFFPGSTPVYVGGNILAGGVGVSGDGVDQDDVVTAYGQIGFAAPDSLRVDQYSVGSVRLPFQKFNRNPNGA